MRGKGEGKSDKRGEGKGKGGKRKDQGIVLQRLRGRRPWLLTHGQGADHVDVSSMDCCQVGALSVAVCCFTCLNTEWRPKCFITSPTVFARPGPQWLLGHICFQNWRNSWIIHVDDEDAIHTASGWLRNQDQEFFYNVIPKNARPSAFCWRDCVEKWQNNTCILCC